MKKQSIYMLATLAVTSILGLAFWKVLAEFYDTNQVGQLGSILSFGVLVATFVTSGAISGLFADSYANQHEHKKIIASKSLSAAIISTTISLVAVALLSNMDNFVFLKTPTNFVGVSLFAGLTAYSLVLDAGLTANITAAATLIRQTIQSVVKIAAVLTTAALVSLISGVTNGVIASIIALLLSIVYVALKYFKKEIFTKPDFKFNNWGKHQILSSGFIILPLSLPLIINIAGTSSYAAIFYISWLIGSLSYMIAPTIANAMLSKIDDTDKNSFKNNVKKLKQTLASSLAMNIIALLGFIFLGNVILSIFGTTYKEAYLALCLIGLISIFNGITQTIVSYIKSTGFISEVYLLPWVPFIGVSAYVAFKYVTGSFNLESTMYTWVFAEIFATVIALTIFAKIFKHQAA